MKYTILHSFSGVELILKHKLKQIDWKLLFQKVNEADWSKLNDGSLYSVNHWELIKHLKIRALQLTMPQLKNLEN